MDYLLIHVIPIGLENGGLVSISSEAVDKFVVRHEVVPVTVLIN